MPQDNSQTVKIRFKLPSGEEFEAEGPKEFIEEQKAYFLHLTGKNTPTASWSAAPTHIFPKPEARPARPLYPLQDPSPSNAPAPMAPSVPPQPPVNRIEAPAPAAVSPVWEKLFKIEDGALILRRKSRLLTPQTAALVLIAAARILRKENEYSALHLSKSLRKSGYGEGRLDRLLLPEMRSGSVESAGSKRSRAYKLSSEGFARAVVLAEKIAEDI